MADVQRYVLVDPETLTILEGAFAWDGETPWPPGEDPNMILEADAYAAGYSWPPPPPPEPEPEVRVGE